MAQALWSLPAVSQAAGIRRGEWTAAELAASVAGRTERVDPLLNAYCTRNDRLMEQARAADAGRTAGDPPPLRGVPFSVKDLLPTAGIRTTLGSLLHAGWVPGADEVAVERLRAAGGLVAGKTNTRELGYGAVADNRLFGPTRNPWSPARTSTGSSGGAAAAVAAGMASVALGTDGGGSVRVPAAACGVLGLKPTFGVVPMFPAARAGWRIGLDSWRTLECVGPMARTVADLRAVFELISGPDPRDPLSRPMSPLPHRTGPVRVGLSLDLGWCEPSPAVTGLVADAVTEVAAACGWSVRPVRPELPSLAAARRAFAATVAADTDLPALRELAGAVPVSPDIEELLAERWTAERMMEAAGTRRRLTATMDALLDDIDVLITPTLATTAFPVGLRQPPDGWAGLRSGAQWSPFAFLFNLTGQPALSVPAGLAPDGLPVGLQLVARRDADRELIGLAADVERVRPWAAPELDGQSAACQGRAS
jgi:aspartyl-tRNA(Asn)/glutamyl-tRNA(Gln) amidotransferase subunit A